MIAESTPFGGINLNTTETIKYNETDPWDRWFKRVIDLIEEYDIDMFSYINCDWESQQMWHHTGFGDTRLSVNKEVMDKWNRIILGDEGRQKFLQGGELTCAEAKETFHEELDKDFEADDYISFVVLAVLFAALVVLSKIYRPKPEVKNSEKTPLNAKKSSSSGSKSMNSSYHSLKSGSYSLTGYETPGDLAVHKNLSQHSLPQRQPPTLMMQEYMNLSGASLTGRINSITSMHSVTTSSMHGRVGSSSSIRGRVESTSSNMGSVKSNQSIYTNGKQQMHGPVQSNSSLYARSN